MNRNIVDTLDELIMQARTEKQASLRKQATDLSEPTAHPVMKVDDGTQPAKQGERSKENISDVKANLGSAGMTGQEDGGKGEKKNPVDSIGTQKMESDEVKGNVSTPKATKDKPDESPSHQSNSTFNEKYSSVISLGNKIVEGFTALLNKEAAAPKPEPKAETKPTEKEAALSKEAEEKLAAANQFPEDAKAGYVMASYFLNTLAETNAAQVKQASEAQVGIENIIKTAQEDAELVLNYLAGRQNGYGKGSAMRKQALEAGAPVPGADEGAEAGGGGGAEALGLPPGGEQPQDEEQVLDALAQALEEAGVTPEELAQALEQEQAEGGAGAGPEAGAPAPEVPPVEAAPAAPAPDVKTAAVKAAAEAVKAAAAAQRQKNLVATLKTFRK